jgi:hypothetical protein
VDFVQTAIRRQLAATYGTESGARLNSKDANQRIAVVADLADVDPEPGPNAAPPIERAQHRAGGRRGRRRGHRGAADVGRRGNINVSRDAE